MNKNEMIVKYLSVLAEIHNKKSSETLQMVYLKILKDYSYEQLEVAFDSLLKTVKFYPKPVEIIEAIIGGKEDRSLTAWTKVITAVREYGYYSSIDFGDPLIVRAINLIGGWKIVCHTLTTDMIWVQKEFERIYKNLIILRYSGKSTVVIGHIEMKNKLDGFLEDIPKPIKIGDQIKKEIRKIK